MMNFLKSIKLWQWALVSGLVALSAATWYFLYIEHLTLVYNDARSYMNISRAVVDNQQPGLAQIGSVWLPLVHVLKLPLIWIDWAWHSGFAGSALSMAAYVATVIGVYAIVKQLTNNRLAGAIGGVVVALNVNLLYLQSTPLTEPLYLTLLVWSAFFLVMYVKTAQVKYILPLAFSVALQVMTRYDGWFVAAAVAALLLAHELWIRRMAFKKALGHVLLFAVPIAFTCLLWFGWNAAIFGDPLYFATGPYSARAQQEVIDSTTGLPTKGDIGTAFEAYSFAVVGNIGWLILGTALAGWAIYLATQKRKTLGVPLTAASIFMAVFVFNILALFLGFSIINVPELNYNTSSTIEPLFNVRYGILMLPFIAVGAGLLVAKWRYAAALVIGLVAFQGVMMIQEKPITLRDGQAGSSAFRQQNLADAMKQRVKPGDQVLISVGTFNPVIFGSGIELKQMVHEGVEHRWDQAIANPDPSIKWIVMGYDTDLVYKNLHDSQAVAKNYKKVYQDQHGIMYERIESSSVPTRN